MRKCALVILLVIPFALLQATWYPLEPTPIEYSYGAYITYGGGYIWCFQPTSLLTQYFAAYDVAQSHWHALPSLTGRDVILSAIAYESGINRRIFVAIENYLPNNDELLVYTRYRPDNIDGEWNREPISLPEDCGPGVSLAYQPDVRNGYLIGGWLYLLIGGGRQTFYRAYFPIPDTSIPPRGNGSMSVRWEPLPNIPIGVYNGGAICFYHFNNYGSTWGDSIFALVGGGNTDFYIYCPGQRVWQSETPTTAQQWGGTAITPGGQRLGYHHIYAIFGSPQTEQRHWKCELSTNWPAEWHQSHQNFPWPIDGGNSITCIPEPNDLYLAYPYYVTEDNTNFFVCRNPESDEVEGAQASEISPVYQKSKVLSYPNGVEIRYFTETLSHVRIQVYGLSGKRVKTLISEEVQKGEHRVIWNRTDNSNRKVASGIYLITIDKENTPERLKVIIR